MDELADRRKRKQIVEDIAFAMDEMERSIPCIWFDEDVPQTAIIHYTFKDKKT